MFFPATVVRFHSQKKKNNDLPVIILYADWKGNSYGKTAARLMSKTRAGNHLGTSTVFKRI
jgi:hypothetical protein